MEYLQSLSITDAFNEKEFERIYRNGGSQANAYSFGVSIADRLIFLAHYNKQNNTAAV
jgi:hypothetical protein